MKRIITPPGPDTTALVKEAWQDIGASFERFCLTAGIATLSRMMTEDAERLCGPPWPLGHAYRASLGADQGEDRLSRWHGPGRTAARA
jgi:hypothetical protein